MPKNRFFIDRPFHEGALLDLSSEAHHLKVMRLGASDEVEVVNGRNQLAHACLESNSMAKVISVEEIAPPFPIIICQAMPRPNKLDFIVEKSTELGATEIWLFPADHSEKRSLSDTQIIRLKNISIAAMKQCGRYDLPIIKIMPHLDAWGDFRDPAYFGDLSDDSLPFLSVLEKREKLFCIIGPESGWSDHERLLLKQKGAVGVKFHKFTLRTETSSLAALSIIGASID